MAFSPPVARLVTTALSTLFCRFPTLGDNTSSVEHNSASLEGVLASLEDASAQLEGVLAQLEDASAQLEMTLRAISISSALWAACTTRWLACLPPFLVPMRA